MKAGDVMIVAGEASGDLHGSRLVAAMKEMQPHLSFCGIGGKELLAQGIEPLYDSAKLSVVGLFEVLGHLQDIRQAMRILEERLRTHPPRLLILIDFPDFNLMIAKKAKRLSIPVFYYISPQVWAWRSGRVKKIARLVDRMAVILPFEKDFYKQKGMDVDFVGHPLMDSVKSVMTREEFLLSQGIPVEAKVVGILPGSRKKEVNSILPTFLEAAKMLAADMENITFVCPLAPSLTYDDLKRNGLESSGLHIKVVTGNRYDLMASCDAVMAVSGTVTLELAMLNVPMVVAYRVSLLSHFLGSRLIKVHYASLVNLIADKEVVPEFLQKDMTPENIHREMMRILLEKERNETMRHELRKVCDKLGGPGASQRAADIAVLML
jgi:lipid-A-disaccharide synthase